MIKRLLVFLILFFSTSGIFAQEYLFSLNRDLNTRVGRYLETDSLGFHTAMKPYTMAEVNKVVNSDSLFALKLKDNKFYQTWFGRKLRKEHLLFVNADDIILSLDPVFNFQAGRDFDNERNVYVNTKGLLINGNVQDKFFFYTGFHENQARYPLYIDHQVRRDSVVPGQGKVKFLEDEAFDFSQAYGGIAYTLNRHFDFLLAHDKNFIGDGYRSLLLSDNTYNYPFLRINMTFWKFRYTVLYNVMQDLKTAHEENVGYLKKYSTIHYLDLNIGRRNEVSVGIFEAVVWESDPSRGYELHYLNPILFLRPVENSMDSPDNALLGLTAKWKVNSRNVVYGQLLLDEFLLDEVKAGNGWWGNKQGFQFGFKSYNLFKANNLNIQSEFNFVRPFTYAHRSNSQNYTHYNQALAHPLGSNFVESVSFLNYRWKSLFTEVKFQYAKAGADTGSANLGNDIFKSYETRSQEYNNWMFQGLEHTLNTIEIRFEYLVNPKTNFNIELGAGTRNVKNEFVTDQTSYFFFGIRTALENYYFDY